MKRLFSILLFVLAFATGHSQNNFDPATLLQHGGASDHLVTDYASTLTADQRQALEDKLVAFNDSTSNQIAVVIVPTLKGNDIADYTTEVFRAWGIGTKKNNNGVMLLISVDTSHRELHIATGYGLEGALPDVTCKEIIDDIIVPKFKDQDLYRGIDEGTDAIMQAVKGEYGTSSGDDTISSATKSPHHHSLLVRILLWIGGIIVLLILLKTGLLWPVLNIASIIFSGSGSGGGGGGFSGFGGGSSGGGGASGSW